MGWQGYDNEGCMPGDRERFLRLQQGMRRIDKPSSPSYTLAELTILCREYALEMENSEEGRQDINLRLTMSSLLAWLAKREQGEVSGR